MKNFPKAGLLIVTLVIPALIFVLLKLFATNHYDLPYFNPETRENGQVVITNGDTVFQKTARIELAAGNVRLMDQISVISFLRADCSDSCKLVLANLQRIQGMREAVSDLVIRTMAINGAAMPAEFETNAGKPGWQIIDADRSEVDSLMAAQSPLFRKSLELYLEEKRLILIDRAGYTRGFYNGADPEEIDRLMAEIKILHYETKERAK